MTTQFGFFRRKKLEDAKEAEGDFVPPPQGISPE
jgi:hypothetical protein